MGRRYKKFCKRKWNCITINFKEDLNIKFTFPKQLPPCLLYNNKYDKQWGISFWQIMLQE